MTFKLNTYRNVKGLTLMLWIDFRRTFKNELDGEFRIFFIRWGIGLRFGPKYLVGP